MEFHKIGFYKLYSLGWQLRLLYELYLPPNFGIY